MTQFTDQTVIVTGAGSGIGYGFCKRFAERGATVALNDLDANLAGQAAAKINTEIGRQAVYPYTGDMSDPDTIFSFVEAVSAQHGPPHIAIANAGLSQYVRFLECTPETFDKVTNLNLRGSYFLAQAAAKQMIAHKIRGRIILLSSVVGIRAFPNFSVDGMTKAGLQMMASMLALELGTTGITVNAISPGAILTERTQRQDPKYAENWGSVSPNGRVGYVEDIVNTALFLCAPESSHVTGQNITVDGGWTLPGVLPDEHPELPLDEVDQHSDT